jgi:hypothetical protein
MLLLPIVENSKLQGSGRPQWHNGRTKFRKNQSIGSRVEGGDTHTGSMVNTQTYLLYLRKESRLITLKTLKSNNYSKRKSELSEVLQ